jgi:DNA-binding response OmpR family regulator
VTNGTRILLVEDEDLIRSLLSEAMAEDGFVVVVASTGDEALLRLRSGEGFDLLMTDIQLPGTLDGIGLAHAARADSPNLPIIFTTGQPDRMVPWRHGAADTFIPKPYRPSDVCAAARRLTEGH